MMREMHTYYKYAVAFLVLVVGPAAVGASICTEPVATQINFAAATLTKDDLEDSGEVRWSGIGSIGNQQVDLLIKAYNFQAVGIEPGSGKKGDVGAIALQPTQGNPGPGKATFEFCFVQPNTNTRVVADSFYWYV